MTDIQDYPNIDVASRFPYDVIVDFIDDTGGKIPGWSLSWCGADDPIFVVVVMRTTWAKVKTFKVSCGMVYHMEKLMTQRELAVLDSGLLELRRRLSDDLIRIFHDPNVVMTAERWVEANDPTPTRAMAELVGPELAQQFVTLLSLTHVRTELLRTLDLTAKLVALSSSRS